MKTLLTARYGAPHTQTKESVSDTEGSTFAAEVLSWSGSQVRIQLRGGPDARGQAVTQFTSTKAHPP
jgi:hypothetical protein